MNRSLVWLALAVCAPSAALAVTTQKWALGPGETFDKGKVEGAAVTPSGKVVRGMATTRTALEGPSVAFASVEGPGGTLFVATGTDGTIYRVDGNKVTAFAKTDAALITSLNMRGKTLLAGSVPGGRVLAIDERGGVSTFATLDGADHIWALSLDAKRDVLYAGTGPHGRIFSIDAKGKASLLHDDEAEHILALALDARGQLYAGTSNGARLLRLRDGKTEVLFDADGQEITALALGPGAVAIASNDFPEAPATTPDGPRDATPAGRARRPKPGKGRVIRVAFDGDARQLFQSDVGHVSALAFEPGSGALQVGLGAEGHVYRIAESGECTRWADFEERQVAAIQLAGKRPHILTSDGAALYDIRSPDAQGTWTSAVLDAKSRARFGELRARHSGVVSLSTRSGNTDPPGKDWSAWSAEQPTESPVKSPEARFLQVRATLTGEAELYAIEAYYLPQNLPAAIRNVRVAEAKGNTLTLRWDVDNPDQDRLRHRVWFQREDQASQLPITHEREVLDRAELAWDTSHVPDGFYRVTVEVSDELASPPPFATSSRSVSPPLLVDHGAPEITRIELDAARVLHARVRDALGPVVRAEVAVDAEPALPIAPIDGLLDEREEELSLALKPLSPGPHLITLRVFDAAENVTTQTIERSAP
ncbi:MAG: hypothetical protein RL385_2904 [Pseudomonadota bacterium]|jgi:hypothetical protein